MSALRVLALLGGASYVLAQDKVTVNKALPSAGLPDLGATPSQMTDAQKTFVTEVSAAKQEYEDSISAHVQDINNLLDEALSNDEVCQKRITEAYTKNKDKIHLPPDTDCSGEGNDPFDTISELSGFQDLLDLTSTVDPVAIPAGMCAGKGQDGGATPSDLRQACSFALQLNQLQSTAQAVQEHRHQPQLMVLEKAAIAHKHKHTRRKHSQHQTGGGGGGFGTEELVHLATCPANWIKTIVSSWAVPELIVVGVNGFGGVVTGGADWVFDFWKLQSDAFTYGGMTYGTSVSNIGVSGYYMVGWKGILHDHDLAGAYGGYCYGSGLSPDIKTPPLPYVGRLDVGIPFAVSADHTRSGGVIWPQCDRVFTVGVSAGKSGKQEWVSADVSLVEAKQVKAMHYDCDDWYWKKTCFYGYWAMTSVSPASYATGLLMLAANHI